MPTICGFCDSKWDSIEELVNSGHSLNKPCPQRSGIPCPECGNRKRGDCIYCTNGCMQCDYTGMCRSCAGTGDANPTNQHRAEWEKAKTMGVIS